MRTSPVFLQNCAIFFMKMMKQKTSGFAVFLTAFFMLLFLAGCASLPEAERLPALSDQAGRVKTW
jgi:hypothetical protein